LVRLDCVDPGAAIMTGFLTTRLRLSSDCRGEQGEGGKGRE
jgi:hypothetical protein